VVPIVGAGAAHRDGPGNLDGWLLPRLWAPSLFGNASVYLSKLFGEHSTVVLP